MMQPTIPSEFFVAGAWLWESFGKEFIESSYIKAKNAAYKQWQKVEWTIAARRYRERIYELHSTMRMLGNPAPVSVEGLFTQVYLHDKPLAYRRFDIERLKREQKLDAVSSKAGVSTDALDVITISDKLFVLGKPGAGKTTLSKYLTLLSAKGKIDKVPIYISLHDWAQSGFKLFRYIEKQFDICDFPDAEIFIEKALLEKGRSIILFDGLDEISEQDNVRQKKIQEIEDFTNKYWKNKFLITCRVSATDYSFEKFSYVEIADFSPSQIKIYVEKWFANHPQKGDLFLDELGKEENYGLQELARTPILLNLLCLSFDETLYFPSRLVDLYQEAIDALLKKWDSSRNIKRDDIYRTLSVTRKQQLLARIAAEFFEKKEFFFSENHLIRLIEEYLKTFPGFEGDIDGGSILKAIEGQHGLLVERAHRIHSFSHLTLQEYFVAKYIIENGSDRTIQKLINHITDRHWHEVFIMVTSLLPHADIFFETANSVLQDIRGYSFPIKLSRMLRSLRDYSSNQRLNVLYITLAYKLNIRSELSSLQKLGSELVSRIGNPANLKSVRKNTIEITKILSALKTSIDERGISYACLEALDSINHPFSHFINTKVVPSSKYSFEKTISITDDIDMKIRGHLNKIQKQVQDLNSALDDDKLNNNSRQKKLNKIVLDITKTIKDTYSLLDKVDGAMGFAFTEKAMDWTFDANEINELLDYIYTQKLLLECLKVASVSNRQKILHEMFLQ